MIRQLRGLRTDAADPDGVDVSLRRLMAQLAEAIPSFLGMTVTFLRADGELALTAVRSAAPRAPRTSLRISLLGPEGHLRVVLYAYQPGALIDLDADLTYLSQPSGGGRTPAAIDLRLDQDLTPQH